MCIDRFLDLSLVASVHLETLKITTSDDGHTWLISYLSRLLASHLKHLRLAFIGQQNIWALQTLCRSIDVVLTVGTFVGESESETLTLGVGAATVTANDLKKWKFTELEDVCVGLHRGDNDWDDEMDTPEEWRSSVSRCFPALHQRGVVKMAMLPW